MPSKSPAASTTTTPTLDNIRSILQERGKTHGDWGVQSLVVQAIKQVFAKTPNWPKLTPMMRETLDNGAQKLSRILVGNPDEPDHWRDIAGYFTLTADAIEKALAEIAKQEQEPKPDAKPKRAPRGAKPVRENAAMRRQRDRKDRRTGKSG